MKIAITGHRPNKLGNDYDLTSPLIKKIKEKIIDILDEYKPDELITGMALGIDTLFADIAIEKGIPFVAAIPCYGQTATWFPKSKLKYNEIISKAKDVVVVTKIKYDLGVMQKRNEWMCDRCDLLIAVWNMTSGGTGNCVKYAQSKAKQIIFINPYEL